ncbi:MAG: Gfo/Idh/MocA family oxidoreductase [Bacteroidota bacterium]
MKRRKFIKTTALSSGAVTLGTINSFGAAKRKKIRIGFIGVGNRGRSLLNQILNIDWVEVPAICDIDTIALAAAQDIIKKQGRQKANEYGDNELDYKKLVERDDLDAVIIATYWQWHTPMAVDAMKAGKYVGVEVPAALSIDECWQLVNTSEETGLPCMMLENWSFRQDNLAILNMIREGLFGDIVHCHCAHSHDCIDHWFFDSETGEDRWPAEFLLKYNRDQYPTHSLGPVLSWLDIPCGDTFDHITSMATDSKGINAMFIDKFGKEHPGAKREYAQGDIVTSMIRTKMGKTIMINYDMQLPRPYDNRWALQGTKGIYNEQRNALYIKDTSPEYHQWESFPPYQDRYNHRFWQNESSYRGGGHGGVDLIQLGYFAEAVRDNTQTPIDVYESVLMSCVVALSGDSIAKGSQPVEVPDFTKGKWKTRNPTFAI